jgi:hypothetical protein
MKKSIICKDKLKMSIEKSNQKLLLEQCPSELKYRVCSKRYDSDHKHKYSHFNQTPIKLMRVKDGAVKCVCRYSVQKNATKSVCWAKDLEEHNKAFHHDH